MRRRVTRLNPDVPLDADHDARCGWSRVRRLHPGRVGYRGLAPRPNQRTWRSVPNAAFSAAVSTEGPVNVPVG